MKLRPVEQLPDPWLFDSEKLLTELDRCREIILLIPVNGDPHATHFGVNNAISVIWNLRQQLQFLLSLHKDGQRQFAKKSRSAYELSHETRSTDSDPSHSPIHKIPKTAS